jgi:hypothetical protein
MKPNNQATSFKDVIGNLEKVYVAKSVASKLVAAGVVPAATSV